MSDATTPGRAEPRFAGFDAAASADQWDRATRATVLARLRPPPPLTFFDPAEAAIGTALVDALLGQHTEPKVPVLVVIDHRLARDDTDGWHYADMPPDTRAWRASLAGLDHDARAEFGTGFADCSVPQQHTLLESVRTTDGTWHSMPAARLWELWMRYACTAFYAHPWAWNEIGFPGPAYPRGYKNLGIDAREGDEVADARPTDDPVRRGSH